VSAAVDVIVDRQDDIATVRAIHALAARAPGVLAVSIVPGLRSETEVVWAILRALGKRIDQLAPNIKVWWSDGERWLAAHHITEIAVLCAQHLDERMIDELKAHVCRRLGIAVALIYGRAPRGRPAAVTDLGAYLARKRDLPPAGDQAEPWPQVPRSHPLRFRYDCWRGLEPEQFARVERRLFGCMTMLGGWCRSTDPSYLSEIERAFRVLVAADDPELAYVRRCGAELALLTHQIPTLPAAPLSLRPHPVPARKIDAVHAYTNPARAGYHLARMVTGLPDELLALIGYEQITDQTILGCPVPEAARPILRAIEERHEPVLDIPWPDPAEQGEDPAARDIVTEEPPAIERDFATALGSLLRGRSVRMPCRELSWPVRSRFDALRADGILDRRCRVYRASHIALYSSFRVDDPADLGTDKRLGRSTDNPRESR
jgi:hypothetical protein